MRFDAFFNIAKALPANITVLIRGQHGIGKSQSVYQLGQHFGLKVIERRLSQMSEGDMIGLPDKTKMGDEGVTKFNPPDWYMEACREPRLLFLDELNRATPEILQASFQIGDSRVLNGHKLHPETRVYSAINATAEYTVNDMDPALLDRFWVTDLDPDVNDWLSWAKGNVHPMVYDFIQTNPRHLEHRATPEPGRVYPSRRSWEWTSNALKHAEIFESPENPLFYGICLGMLGAETAAAFQKFAESVEKDLTADDVLNKFNKKMEKRMESFGNEQFLSVLEKVADWTDDNIFTPKQLKNLVRFCSHVAFPKELMVTLWSKLADRPDNKLKEENLKQYEGELTDLIVKSIDIEALMAQQAEDAKKKAEEEQK